MTGTPDRDLPLGLRDGDRGIYKICQDPDCPANRPGTNHAHFDRFERDSDVDIISEQPRESE